MNGISNFYNLEYEKILLGTLMLHNEIIDEASVELQTIDFQDLNHREIFGKICECYKKYKRADLVTIVTELAGAVRADIVSDLTSYSTGVANIDFYYAKLQEYSKKRQHKDLLTRQLEKLNEGENVYDNIQATDSAVSDLMTNQTIKTVDVKNIIPEIVQMMSDNFARKEKWLGFDSGFENLNDKLNGLRKGKLIIVGARPSMGKSAFALQLAANLCKSNVQTSVFSYEMDYKELGIRLASFESGVSINMIESGFAAQSYNLMGKLNNAFNRIQNYPLSIIDEPLRTEKELFSMIRVQVKEGKQVFIVDHLGLVKHSNDSLQRYEQVGDITIRLHQLAKELGITIICLCQLKRDAEGKKPALSDLRESGDIEQNADVILFIHRARAQGGESEIPSEILVEKNRGGSTGLVKMMFIPDQTKFVEVKNDNLQPSVA